MKSTQFLLVAAVLVSSPAEAAPPNEVYSFDVISETLTGPICNLDPTRCVSGAPYHLATLTVTHEAFAPNHEASLSGDASSPSGAADNGVVSLVFATLTANLEMLDWPSTFFPPGAPPFLLAQYTPIVEVQLDGEDITGSIKAMPVAHDAPNIAMTSGIDDHWIGQWGNSSLFIPVHTFVATVTRVPPGLTSQLK